MRKNLLRYDLSLHIDESVGRPTWKERTKTHPFFLSTLEQNDVEPRYPSLKLSRPVVERTLGDDDEVRTVNSSIEFEVTEERDRLKRFTESLPTRRVSRGLWKMEGTTDHFVGENSVDSVVMKSDHPVQPLNLILSHFSSLDVYHNVSVVERVAGGWNDGQAGDSVKTKGPSSCASASLLSSSSSSFSVFRPTREAVDFPFLCAVRISKNIAMGQSER